MSRIGSVTTRGKNEPMIWRYKHSNGRSRARITFLRPAVCLAVVVAGGLAGCARSEKARAESEVPNAVTVGVTKIGRKTLERELTVSSELVPFQEVDVYAKESGYVHDLLVDYGTR